jgi:pimeloyl-ACP methyl ester carboxylesterase
MHPANFFICEFGRITCERITSLICILLSFQIPAASQPSQRDVPHLKSYLGSPYGFWEYLPADYQQSSHRYAMVLYLHGIKETGSGESLDDLKKVIQSGVPFVIHHYERDFPFIVISPQSAGIEDGFPADKLDQLLEIIKANYRVDENRIYVTGLSFGAYAALRLAAYIPQKIAAVVPISSCGGNLDFEKLKHVPMWAFGNEGDKKQIPDCLNAMIDSIQNHGGTPLLTLYNRKGHNAWARTYREYPMWNWLLKQHRPQRNENQSPIIINPGNKTLGVGCRAYFRIMANDADNDELKFSVIDPLPKASKFVVRKNGDADLLLNTLKAGIYHITILVSDGKGGEAIQKFSVVANYELLLLPYLLLVSLQPFITDLPLVSLCIFLPIVEIIISSLSYSVAGRLVGYTTKLKDWSLIRSRQSL